MVISFLNMPSFWQVDWGMVGVDMLLMVGGEREQGSLKVLGTSAVGRFSPSTLHCCKVWLAKRSQ
jgi:hypothetical protein